MTTTAIISAILTLLSGIGIFLIACQMMSTNLESASSSKLKNLFAKASKSKLLGVGIGALGTAAIQSSGATTVMVIGFVNAGIISLAQAATMIYGANIGTTITAQIVALGMFGESLLSTTVIFSAFAGIGAFMMLFSKKDFWERFGEAFFTEQTKSAIARVGKITAAANHRPLNPQSEEHKSFCRRNLDEIEHLKMEFVGIDFSEEEGKLANTEW